MRARLVLANIVALVVLIQVAFNPVDHLIPRWQPTGTAAEIVAAVAARHIHGSTDDLLTVDELSKAAVYRPIVATCGTISSWTVALLRQAGYEARVVTTLTDEEWNGFDNGHTMASVRIDGTWAVFDVDRGVQYTDLSGHPVSIRELVSLVSTDAYRIIPLAGPVGEGLIRQQNRRLLQEPGIGVHGDYWFPATGSEAARIVSFDPSYHTLPPDAWAEEFYGDEG